MTIRPVKFKKYDEMGAYHWYECDINSKHYNPALEARYRVVLKRLNNSEKILDIGCGDGYLMNLMGSIGNIVVGIDSEFNGVKNASKKLFKYKNCFVVQANCYKLPFDNASFDSVVLADVIEHLQKPEYCISEIRRVLKVNGILILTTPKFRDEYTWDDQHVFEFKPEELQSILRTYFSNIKIIYFWPMFWSNLYATKIGWRFIKLFSRYFYNPFLAESSNDPEKYGQMLAICQISKR